MRWLLFLGVVTTTAWACGGQTGSVEPIGDGGTSSSGSRSDSGSSGSSSGSTSSSGTASSSGSTSSSGGSPGTGCPPNLPSLGTPCSPQGIECEYGDNPNPQCNTLVYCTETGWDMPGGTGACVPQGGCPSSYAAATSATSCTQQGLECAYAQGQCTCSYSVLPVQPNQPKWQCSSPTGCPEPRPRIGSACANEGQTCDYGVCNGAPMLQCTTGVWTEDNSVACAGAAGTGP